MTASTLIRLIPRRLMLLPTLCLLGAAAGCVQVDEYDIEGETAAWHTKRLERLRSETGWLTLVGLHPLVAGANSLGAADDNAVVLTAAAPARVGTITLGDAGIEFAAAPGVEAHLYVDGTVQSAVFAAGTIKSDAEGSPDQIAVGSLVFYVIVRGDQAYLRVKDRQSPVLLGFRGIDRYPVKRSWRVPAKLEGEPGTVEVVNVLGQVTVESSPGLLVFQAGGQTCRLRPTGEPGEGLFVVFGDATNGQGTYPGGRFLATDPPAEDGTVMLDFNRAYNPPCVFTEYATCPLPGPQNVLPIAVTAGEKMWGTGH